MSMHRYVVATIFAMFIPIPAADPSASELAKAAPVPGGLFVHAGAKNAQLAADMAAAGPWVVAVLPADAATADAIRADVAKRSLNGQVTVLDGQAGSGLPFPANSITALVLDGDALGARAPSADEIKRALRPDGVGRIGKSGTWTATTKARPAEMDSWPQFHGDASMNDRNNDDLIKQPRSMQWTGGGNLNDENGVRTNGRVLVTSDNLGGGVRRLVGRDPFTGVLLWRSEISSVNRYCLLMDDKRVYVHGDKGPMVALNCRTGVQELAFDQGFTASVTDYTGKTPSQAWPQALLLDGVLVQTYADTLYALDTATGKLLWKQVSPNGNKPRWAAAADGQVVYCEGPRPTGSNAYLSGWSRLAFTRVIARNLKTGTVNWTWNWSGASEPFLPEVSHLSLGEGKVNLCIIQATDAKEGKNGYAGFQVLDAATGKEGPKKELRRKGKQEAPSGLSGHSSVRSFIRDGQVWMAFFGSITGYSLTDGTEATTGKFAGSNRCFGVRTTRTLAFGSTNVTSLVDDRYYSNDSVSSLCDMGMFPAEGLLFNNSTYCGCFALLPSSNAFSSEAPPAPITGERLTKGAAVAAPAKAAAGTWPAPGDWPMHMRDATRSSRSMTTISASPTVRWTVKLPEPTKVQPLLTAEWDLHPMFSGPVSSPSCAEGLAVVGLTSGQAVVGLDPQTGKIRWQTQVDGRVDSAPTIYKGLVLFGTRLGWIYALNRDTGALAWRFFAAPAGRTIVAHGQLESAWPVFGTVAVVDGTLWAAAGRELAMDEGFWWWGLDPLTGAVRKSSKTGFSGEWMTPAAAAKNKRGQPILTGHVFGCAASATVANGTSLFMQRFGIDTATGSMIREVPYPYYAPAWKPEAPRYIVPGGFGLTGRGESGTRGRHGDAALYASVPARFHAVVDAKQFLSIGTRGPQTGGREFSATGSTLMRFEIQDAHVDKVGWVKSPWNVGVPDPDRAGGASGLAVAGDTVVAVVGSKVFAYAFADGKPLWNLALPARGVFGGIAAADGGLIITCTDGSVVGIR